MTVNEIVMYYIDGFSEYSTEEEAITAFLKTEARLLLEQKDPIFKELLEKIKTEAKKSLKKAIRFQLDHHRWEYFKTREEAERHELLDYAFDKLESFFSSYSDTPTSDSIDNMVEYVDEIIPIFNEIKKRRDKIDRKKEGCKKCNFCIEKHDRCTRANDKKDLYNWNGNSCYLFKYGGD